MVMIFCTNTIFAQSDSKNNVPGAVITAFAAKYPKAEVKNWAIENDEYTAKAKGDNGKYFATFDKNGDWVKTVSKFNWPWHLTPVVRKAFKNSQYGAWHIYGINIVEKPSGQFYQVMVDDANHPVDAFHQNVSTQNRLLEFKSDGELVKEKNTDEIATL